MRAISAKADCVKQLCFLRPSVVRKCGKPPAKLTETQTKSARWNSPRISQRALFSSPPGSGLNRSTSPRRSNDSMWLSAFGCWFIGALASAEQAQNTGNSTFQKFFYGPEPAKWCENRPQSQTPQDFLNVSRK
jgi:hypothetical protein